MPPPRGPHPRALTPRSAQALVLAAPVSAQALVPEDVAPALVQVTVAAAVAADATDAAEAEGKISRFRADTKVARIDIAREAQSRYGRKVSWGAQLGETEVRFTHLSVPVMTRLKQPERQVLDTLVNAPRLAPRLAPRPDRRADRRN